MNFEWVKKPGVHFLLVWLFYGAITLGLIDIAGLVSNAIAPGPGAIALLPFIFISVPALYLGAAAGFLLARVEKPRIVFIVISWICLIGGLYLTLATTGIIR